ncbi:MAG: hypothetical protein ABI603_01695 [Acidobacteriota bacterium]
MDETSNAPPAPIPQRDPKTGRYLLGNFGAVQHALRTDRLPPEFAHLAEEVAEFCEGSITDDGGLENVGRRRQALHEYRARVHRRVAQLDAALEVRGLFDQRGKLRVAWLQQLQQLVNCAKGIDSLLGLERRARDVSVGLADYIAAAEAEK